MSDVERHSFSVGVDAETDDKRRAVFDAIAILAGRADRMSNHCMAMERMIGGVFSLMEFAPDSFCEIFGEGNAHDKRRFIAWLKVRGDGRGA